MPWISSEGSPMPKVPAYTLVWSPATKAYELYETRERRVLKIVPESPAWFVWLDRVSSFAFSGKTGHYTARKEAKQRGDRYWSASLTAGEQLTKKYLGKTTDLTLARLEHIAGMLSAQSEAQLPLPVTLASASADNKADAARHTVLAQQPHPLHLTSIGFLTVGAGMFPCTAFLSFSTFLFLLRFLLVQR